MYAELHCKTNFSFLEGASHPDELVCRTAELGYAALAVTDRNSLAGVVRAHGAAKECGLKLILGAEITPEDAPPLVLWATDRAAYGRLARLITQGRRRAEKGDCRLRFEDMAEHAEGLLAGIVTGEREEGTGKSEASGQKNEHILHLPRHASLSMFHSYRELFSDRCYLLAELHRGPDDRGRLEQLQALSRQTHIPLVAAGDVHYHVPERAALHDVLTAIRCNSTVAEVTRQLFPNAERHMRSPEEIAALFEGSPDAVQRTLEIAERCTFSLDELRYEYPEELAPPGMTPGEHLAELAWTGAKERYPDGVPEKVRRLMEHELQLIGELHYEAYFLTVWDLVRFARQRGILCQGRGSAANSAVCYCLGVTAVDPERMDVLFERFISRERNEAPDIDVDFEHQRREEVIQYLYEKYGRERAGMTAEVITYRPRSAIRDVGKALGMPIEEVDRLAKQVEHHSREHWKTVVTQASPLTTTEGTTTPQNFVELVGELIGFPRHLSQHTGGMVMTRGPLCELVPIENASMPDRTVIEWNKDDLDELGILKVDCLALGMLTAVRRCFDLAQGHYGRRLTLANIPPADEEVYEMIRRADTMGVFQIESRAQMSMLPRLRPRCFYDLVIEVAIIRPGPIQGGMVHPYLRRRNGEEAVTYPNETVREVLEKTLGVPLFQEQAMRLAVVAAGFTPGEADQLRRAMGAWRRPGIIDLFRRKLIDGMKARGFSDEYAEAVFGQIRGFGDYGFPESHAASFALLVYVSAWLKRHYPAAFTAALLNSQPMGFYAPAQLVRNAREHGVEVLPVDVNFSGWECGLEATAESQTLSLRLGFNMLLGVSSTQVKKIERARRQGAFRSIEDFAQRTGLHRASVARLAKAGVFGSLELDRRNALWEAMEQDQKDMPLFSKNGDDGGRKENAKGKDHRSSPLHVPPTSFPLPAMSPAEEVFADYRTAGFSLRAHPIEFLRDRLQHRGVVTAESLRSLPNGGTVRVAGIVLVRQRPGTAKGITFVTLEDETGTANLIVRPAVWRRWHAAAMQATVLLAEGQLQRQSGVIHVLTTRLEDLSPWMRQLGPQSRDFS
ncbi:MAG: error-prone DNA polymerase [Planctomycetaceae bacterium]|nr:error-prone DNA polymerase [Planctomycetaceae bacterium]